MDEIKRKALEPDPGMKHRVELPGEVSVLLFVFRHTPDGCSKILTDLVVRLKLVQVAAQLNTMREDNMRMWDQLAAERRKVDKLVALVGRLWDVVGKNYPTNCELTLFFNDDGKTSPLT